MSPEWWILPRSLVGLLIMLSCRVYCSLLQASGGRTQRETSHPSYLFSCLTFENFSVSVLLLVQNSSHTLRHWSNPALSLLQPCRCVSQHNHGGGLPDDRHPLQLGRVFIRCQGCSLICWPQLWLPAATAGVSDDTSLRGKHSKDERTCMKPTSIQAPFRICQLFCSHLILCNI